jgi:zona occludens toxin (predicted ATPase)
MDLYQGPVGTNQIHDFNPGIIDSGPAKGLFWTMHIPTHDVHADLGRATATMRVTNADVEDYHTLKNAILEGPSDPASVSFVIRWHGVKARVEVQDFELGFAGRFIEDSATVEWSARVPSTGFRFHSDPATFAEIGSERNGVFFHGAA